MSETRFPLRPTVTDAIEALFAPKNHEIVTEMLAEECNAERLRTNNADTLERIQLAVIKLSEGDRQIFRCCPHGSNGLAGCACLGWVWKTWMRI